MPGEVIAILCAFLYALSYLFLHKAQVKASWPDNGLLPVLFIGALALNCAVWSRAAFTGHLPPASWPGLTFAALSGIIGTLIGRLFLYFAVARLGATRGVVIKTFSPLVTLLFAAIFLDESLDKSDIYGILLLLVSILFLFIERLWIPNSHRGIAFFQKGIFIASMAAFCQGIGHGMRKLAIEHAADAMTSAAVDISAALLLYILFLFLTRKLRPIVDSYRQSRNTYVFTAGLLSACATLVFFVAVTETDVSVVAAITGTEPIIVGLLSLLFFPKLEKISIWTITSAILVAFGVVLLSQ